MHMTYLSVQKFERVREEDKTKSLHMIMTSILHKHVFMLDLAPYLSSNLLLIFRFNIKIKQREAIICHSYHSH